MHAFHALVYCFFLFEMKLSFNCAQITIVKWKSEFFFFEKSMDVAKVIIMNQFSQFWLLIKYESKIVKHFYFYFATYLNHA